LRTPAVRIDCQKIVFNALYLKRFYEHKGIQIVSVLKGASGDEVIAKALIDQGFDLLGDSNIYNLKRYKHLDANVKCMLMRSPALSEIEDVVQYADISLNSEVEVITALSNKAIEMNIHHDVILMLELGDMREGILPDNLILFISKIIDLKNIHIVGLGSNFNCFNNGIPTDEAMKQLSQLADLVEQTFNIQLKWVSGGNSANYDWVLNTKDTYRINQVRIGESILCGTNPLVNQAIPELFQDTFTLFLEVIEAKIKGKRIHPIEQYRRLILNIGHQDTSVQGLIPLSKIEIMNHSSNHLAALTSDLDIHVGNLVEFGMDYIAMMRTMTSPNVVKVYINNEMRTSE
jgi:predicted amino acid racemase